MPYSMPRANAQMIPASVTKIDTAYQVRRLPMKSIDVLRKKCIVLNSEGAHMRQLSKLDDLGIALCEKIENDTGDDDRRKERCRDTDHERNCKTLHCPCSERIKNYAREERGQVTVEDRWECAAIPIVHR